MIAFASSAITTSTAYGREINPAQVSPDNTPATSDENPMLIAPNSQTDNTATILEIAGLVTVITVAAIIVVLRRRTKTSA
jgi:hypothetical protein